MGHLKIMFSIRNSTKSIICLPFIYQYDELLDKSKLKRIPLLYDVDIEMTILIIWLICNSPMKSHLCISILFQ